MKKLSKRHELVVNMPYVLLHFLIQENVLELFCDNTLSTFCSGDISIFNKKDSYYDRSCLIIRAFTWFQTPESHKFWDHIDEKYQMYLSALNNN